MANRNDIIMKIKAMRAKAADAASTESEAMEAAAMAARLLSKHDIRPEELRDVAESKGHAEKFRQGKTLHPVLQRCWKGIEVLCEVKTFNRDGALNIVGLEEDVLMGMYLAEMLVGASKRVWAEYFETMDPKSQRSIDAVKYKRESLMMAFGVAVSDRMVSLAHERMRARQAAQGASNSTALVVVKSEIAAQKLEEMGVTLTKGKRSSRRADRDATAFGYSAGAKVNLNRPFEASQKWDELS